MPEEQDASMPSLGTDDQSQGKMKVRDVLAQSGQLSSMFGQGQGQGQGEGMGDMSDSLKKGATQAVQGVADGASKFSNQMGSMITDIAGGDGDGENDLGQGLEQMGEKVAEMGKEMAEVAMEVTKQVIQTGVQVATMVAGAAVGMPGVGGGGGGMSMGGGGGGMPLGGGGGGLGGLGDALGNIGGPSGGEADAGIADVIRKISGKDDKELKLTVRQATGLSLPQQGMGIDGPKQGIKMR